MNKLELRIEATKASTLLDKAKLISESSLELPYSLDDQIFLLNFTAELLESQCVSIRNLAILNFIHSNIFNLSLELFQEASLLHEKLLKLRIKPEFYYLNDKDAIEKILNLLETRFPQILANETEKIENIIQAVLSHALINFLNKNRDGLERFKTDYPNIYNHFIEPLEKDVKYHSIPLYIFYCNPVRFKWFFALIAGEVVSDYALHKLSHLEKSLSDLATVLDNQTHQLLLKKITILLDASKKNSLYKFTNESYSVFAEIDNMSEVISSKACVEGKIVIPNEIGRKIPDVRLFSKEGLLVGIIEVKGKMPGYGVDTNKPIGFVNDFFINLGLCFSSMIRYLFSIEELCQHFPNLVVIYPSPYGRELSIVRFICEQLKVKAYNHKMTRDNEKELIADMLRALYNTPVWVRRAHAQGDASQRVEEKTELAKQLFQSEFIKSILRDCFQKFCDEKENLKTLPPCTIRWYLALPASLTMEFFADDVLKAKQLLEENIQDGIRDIFNALMKSEFPDLLGKGIVLEFRNF